MAVLELKNISKSFGETKVLKNISLSVAEGEFITLLGSSGCGKTTTLRIIAGLETPESGTVTLHGVDVTNFDPNKRDVNTVFQSYALFPHMNVEKNVAYSLKLRKVPKNEIKEKVNAMLKLVQLEDFKERMPQELSGGQRQRVAIARSLVANPKVLLLDEPLGALDLQLRRQMQTELKKLQQKLGISFIYITHDQEEAVNMSDRIAVMREGRFEQIGTPSDVYDRPKTAYVARFVGSANIIKAVAKVKNSMVELTNEFGRNFVLKRDFDVKDGQTVSLAVRSEQIELHTEAENGFTATVCEKSFNGGMLRIKMMMGETEITASRHGINSEIQVGQKVIISFHPENAVLVEGE